VYRIVERRYLFFLLSAIVLVPGFIFLLRYRIPLAIDFTGGALWEVSFASSSSVTEEGLREVYAANGFEEVQVVETESATGAKQFQVRSAEINQSQKLTLQAALRQKFGDFTELRFDAVGPSVGREVAQNATIAVLMAAIGILLYLTLQFRNVPHSFRYGVCALIAMFHDVFVILGVAAILGHFLHWEVDALFLTALLTVIGFSVHDTIVVFDRIRENVGRLRGLPFERVVNHSIIQTLDRSINTQLTALFALAAVYVHSEGQLERFVFWLLIGIISGSYSSIFNASPLLVVWENREWRRWFRRQGQTPATA
jgi:preprotein translocase subunit SecF